jgi:hypothetical protein
VQTRDVHVCWPPPVSDEMPMIFHAVTVTFENIGGVVVQKDKSGARNIL